jgi:preprotein translocase subunit SecF
MKKTMDIRKKNALLAIIIALVALMLYVGSILKVITASSGQ